MGSAGIKTSSWERARRDVGRGLFLRVVSRCVTHIIDGRVLPKKERVEGVESEKTPTLPLHVETLGAVKTLRGRRCSIEGAHIENILVVEVRKM